MSFKMLKRMGKQLHNRLIDPKHNAEHAAGNPRQNRAETDDSALNNTK